MMGHVVVESMMDKEGGGLLGLQVGTSLGGGFNATAEGDVVCLLDGGVAVVSLIESWVDGMIGTKYCGKDAEAGVVPRV